MLTKEIHKSSSGMLRKESEAFFFLQSETRGKKTPNPLTKHQRFRFR